MKAFIQKHTRLLRYVISVVLICGIVAAPLDHQFKPKEAEALGAITAFVAGGIGTIQETLSAINTFTLQYKEIVLDGIAHQIAKAAVQSMTQSIVQWINSGFKGSPAFVQNLEYHLTGIADRIAGQFIEELGGGFLCAPFALNVQAAMAIQYQNNRDRFGYRNRSQCTLSGVAANLENFGKTPATTSWSNFMQVAMYPQNNPYGAMNLAQNEMSLRVVNAKGQASTLLSFGDGFLSYKKLDDPSCNVDGVHTPDTCPTITPGKTISEALNKSLGAGQDALISADEINEIIGALFAQLAQQAVTGANGLLGLSSGSNGSQSYLDQMNNDESTVGYNGNSFAQISQTLRNEKEFLALNEGVVSTVNSSAALSCSQPLPSSLSSARSAAQTAVTSTRTTITTLEALQARLADAKTDASQSTISTEYQALVSGGTLHTASQLSSARSAASSVSSTAADYQARYCKASE